MKKRPFLQILNLKDRDYFRQINQTEQLGYNTRMLMPSLSSRLFVYVCVAVHNIKKKKKQEALEGANVPSFFPSICKSMQHGTPTDDTS